MGSIGPSQREVARPLSLVARDINRSLSADQAQHFHDCLYQFRFQNSTLNFLVLRKNKTEIDKFTLKRLQRYRDKKQYSY